MFRRWQIVSLIVLVLLALTSLARAKGDPYIEDPANEWDDLHNPTSVWSTTAVVEQFGRLDPSGDVDAFAFDFGEAAQSWPVKLFVPMCGDHFRSFYPSLALIGSGLDTPQAGGLPFALPNGVGAQVFSTMGDSAKRGLANNDTVEIPAHAPDMLSLNIPQAGHYILAVWEPKGNVGAYLLVTGSQFGLLANRPEAHMSAAIHQIDSGSWMRQDCILSVASSAGTQAMTPSVTSSAPRGRFSTFPLDAIQPSGIGGIFTASDNGDGTTTFDVQLDRADNFNPWGIFALSDCHNSVALNQRPVFTLPDIENGHKKETVETSTYKLFPTSLSVVIYGISPDNSQRMVACANLGSPLASETSSMPQITPSAAPDCAIPHTPSLEGSWLAISAEVNGNGDIYLVNVDDALRGVGAKLMKRLTTSPAEDFDPTWSPNGAQIAFRSQRDGNDEIYVMNADGTCQVNVTNNPLSDWSPVWSPDGRRIAFARFFDNNPFTDIAVINPDGSDLQRLTTSSGEYPTWSPDSTRIAFSTARDGNYEIYVMNANRTGETRLTNNPAYDMSPAWSPDGARIAFDTQRDYFPPQETGIGPEFEIHVMNVDGSGDTRLPNNRNEDRFPAWISNQKIVSSRNGMLWLMNADGSEQLPLGVNGNFVVWRPNNP